MSKAIDRILAKGPAQPTLAAEETDYRSMIDSGGRPQMGFCVVQTDGTMDGFLYHNLDNLRLRTLREGEYLTFTHRGTAVTIQGQRLKGMMRAIMRHTLMEIRENDGQPERDDLPVITRLAVTPPEENPAHLRLAKG